LGIKRDAYLEKFTLDFVRKLFKDFLFHFKIENFYFIPKSKSAFPLNPFILLPLIFGDRPKVVLPPKAKFPSLLIGRGD
jgi:hypothetical protein